jgi:quinone-modifying oxidoreductase subunit QmoA
MAGKKITEEVDMVVLATGIVPSTADSKMPFEVTYDDYGFVASCPPGIYAAGCSKRPADVATSVRDATGVALKAIQSIAKGEISG